MSDRLARLGRERVPPLSPAALVVQLPPVLLVALPPSFCEDRLPVREQAEWRTPAQ